MDSKKFTPPTSAPFSIASGGARLIAGKRGVYRKIEFKPLFRTDTGTYSVPITKAASGIKDGVSIVNQLDVILAGAGFTATSYALLFGFDTENPSSRIRHAFGLGTMKPFQGAGGTARFIDNTCQGWVNVIPGMKIKGIGQDNSGSNSADFTEVINGQPIYPYFCGSTTPGTGTGGNFDERQIIGASDLIVGGFDGTPANSGGVASPNGQAFPFAYDAISSVNYWKIRAGVAAPTNDKAIVGPMYAWASWEIVDPRDEEDSEALLADCKLHATTQIIPA